MVPQDSPLATGRTLVPKESVNENSDSCERRRFIYSSEVAGIGWIVGFFAPGVRFYFEPILHQ